MAQGQKTFRTTLMNPTDTADAANQSCEHGPLLSVRNSPVAPDHQIPAGELPLSMCENYFLIHAFDADVSGKGNTLTQKVGSLKKGQPIPESAFQKGGVYLAPSLHKNAADSALKKIFQNRIKGECLPRPWER